MSLLQKENQTTRMPTAGVKKGIMTRSKAGVSKGENFDPNTKRKAEASPPKGRLTKRSAFVDITNVYICVFMCIFHSPLPFTYLAFNLLPSHFYLSGYLPIPYAPLPRTNWGLQKAHRWNC